MTIGHPITKALMLAVGYREYPVPRHDSGYLRLFQKASVDTGGLKYHLNIREWDHRKDGHTTFDAQLSCATETEGHIWVTIREATLESTEEQADRLWRVAGSCYYHSTSLPAAAILPIVPQRIAHLLRKGQREEAKKQMLFARYHSDPKEIDDLIERWCACWLHPKKGSAKK